MSLQAVSREALAGCLSLGVVFVAGFYLGKKKNNVLQPVKVWLQYLVLWISYSTQKGQQ